MGANMNHTLLAVSLAVLSTLTACGSSSTPTSPENFQAQLSFSSSQDNLLEVELLPMTEGACGLATDGRV